MPEVPFLSSNTLNHLEPVTVQGADRGEMAMETGVTWEPPLPF